MFRRSIILFFTLGTLAICWSSCDNDADLSTPTLSGRWEIETATRNGRTTESLVDLYMVFKDNGGFETNLSGTVVQGKYIFAEDLIKTTDVPLAMDYRVEALTDTTLRLKSTYRNYRFDFLFQRVATLDMSETSK